MTEQNQNPPLPENSTDKADWRVVQSIAVAMLGMSLLCASQRELNFLAWLGLGLAAAGMIGIFKFAPGSHLDNPNTRE